MAALAREAFTGQRRERWNEVQVVGGRDDRDVPHVQGEMRQAALDVLAASVESRQRLNGEGVALIPKSE